MSLDLEHRRRNELESDDDVGDGAAADGVAADGVDESDESDDVDGTDPADADRLALPRRVRVTALVALAVAALYMLACVIYNLPSSTVKARLDGADKAIMQPWFEQDWQLFAPTPATANAHLMVTPRVTAASGAVTDLTSFDIQYAIENKPKSDPALPTKQPGITLAAQERFASYQKQLVVIQSAPKANQAALHAQLDKTFAPTLDALDRLISYEAHRKYPTAQITDVKATFTYQAMTPFSERYIKSPPAEPTKTMLVTTWFPYASGVAR